MSLKCLYDVNLDCKKVALIAYGESGRYVAEPVVWRNVPEGDPVPFLAIVNSDSTFQVIDGNENNVLKVKNLEARIKDCDDERRRLLLIVEALTVGEKRGY